MKNYVSFDVFCLYDEVRKEEFYEVHLKDSPEQKQFTTIGEVMRFIKRITKNSNKTEAKVNFDFKLKEIYA